jgi:hypothetical protein
MRHTSLDMVLSVCAKKRSEWLARSTEAIYLSCQQPFKGPLCNTLMQPSSLRCLTVMLQLDGQRASVTIQTKLQSLKRVIG